MLTSIEMSFQTLIDLKFYSKIGKHVKRLHVKVSSIQRSDWKLWLFPWYWTVVYFTSESESNCFFWLPTPILHGKSYYELMFKSSPCYIFLWIFGYASYPYSTPFGCSKLDFKSTRCIFLGYFSKHKEYYCFHFPTGRMFIFRHVLFKTIYEQLFVISRGNFMQWSSEM
jgi:hypothetical protein